MGPQEQPRTARPSSATDEVLTSLHAVNVNVCGHVASWQLHVYALCVRVRVCARARVCVCHKLSMVFCVRGYLLPVHKYVKCAASPTLLILIALSTAYPTFTPEETHDATPKFLHTEQSFKIMRAQFQGNFALILFS
jgi:hypothetical protein